MKIQHLSAALFAACFTFIFSSCLKDNDQVVYSHYTDTEKAVLDNLLDLPNAPLNYQTTINTQFGTKQVVGSSQFDVATLGRVLFYDNKLSKNDKVSCASCHKQSLAFSDDVAKSKGFEGELTERNSIALGSVVSFEETYGGGVDFSNTRLFWDGRASSVADQTKETLANAIEMGMPMSQLVDKLSKEEFYRVLFKKAFGQDVVTEDRILVSINEFMKSFVSQESKFDKNGGQVFQSNGTYTQTEERGRTLFSQNCTSCHGVNLAAPGGEFVSNGLDENPTDIGAGKMFGSGMNGTFKVPQLKNIALTGPYMHDGRFETLEEVVEHYSSGVKNHENLDFRLKDQNNNPRSFNFNAEDKAALVAFLRTTTDTKLLTDVRFSDPFRK